MEVRSDNAVGFALYVDEYLRNPFVEQDSYTVRHMRRIRMRHGPAVGVFVVDVVAVGDLEAVFLDCDDVDEILVATGCDLLQFVANSLAGRGCCVIERSNVVGGDVELFGCVGDVGCTSIGSVVGRMDSRIALPMHRHGRR